VILGIRNELVIFRSWGTVATDASESRRSERNPVKQLVDGASFEFLPPSTILQMISCSRLAHVFSWFRTVMLSRFSTLMYAGGAGVSAGFSEQDQTPSRASGEV
jgi:hypothetical protein